MLFRDALDQNAISYWLADALVLNHNDKAINYAYNYVVSDLIFYVSFYVSYDASTEGASSATRGVRAVVALSPDFIPVVSETVSD